MARVIGYVKSLEQGTFFVKDAKGGTHRLKVGDPVHEGEQIYGADQNSQDAKIIISLTLEGAGDILIAGNAALNFDTSLLKNIFSHHDSIISVESVKKALSLNVDGIPETKDTVAADDQTAAGEVLTDKERTNDMFNNRDAGIGDVRTNLNFTGNDVSKPTVETEIFRPVIVDDGRAILDVPVTNTERPTISINDQTVDEEAGTITFTVTLSNPSASAVSVDYAATSASATVGTDVTGSFNGTLNFAVGELSKTITLDVTNDDIYEISEAFNINLSNPTNATISDAQGVGTIDDEYYDIPGDKLGDASGISVGQTSTPEGSDEIFDVSLTNISTQDVSFDLTTATGTAIASDYDVANMQVSTDNGVTWTYATSGTIVAGETSVLVKIPTVDDTTAEANETFSLTATVTAGDTANTTSTATAIIKDNDSAPTSTNDAFTILEDLNNTVDIYTLTKEDFGTFSDVDGDSMSSVRIDSLPSNGTLYLNGIAVAVSTVISIADINSGKLTFDPINNSDADSLFSFSVNDGTNWSTDSYTSSVDITAVADAPTVALSGSATFTQVIDVMNVTSTYNGFTVSAFHADGSDATLNDAGKSTSVGFGVDGNVNGGASKGSAGEIQYDTALKASETIEVTFENAVTSIDVSFARQSVAESTKVEFYIGDTKVGESVHTGGSNLADSAIHLSATGDVAFDRVVFSAPNDGDDFRIHAISFERTNSSQDTITTDDASTVSLKGIAQLVDADNSEALSTFISGIPDGYTLSDGSNTFTATSGVSESNVTGWDLSKLSLIVPIVTVQTVFELTITGTTKEVSNNDMAVSTNTLEITVIPHNESPVAQNDTGAVSEDATLSVSAEEGVIQSGSEATGKDTDPDGNILSVMELRAGIENGSGATISTVDAKVLEGTYGHLTLNADGSYTYIADKANGLAEGVSVIDSFTYSVNDGKGGADTAQLDITVTGTDDISLLSPDTQTVVEDTTASGNVLSNDSDVDSTLSVATFTVNGVSGTFNAGETATILNVGSVTIATNGDYVFTPVVNWSGTVPTVNYTTNTGSTSTLDIIVTPVNDPSVLAPDTQIVAEETIASGNVLSNDSDVDNILSVATFTVNGVSGTFNAGETATISNVGTLTIATNGDYTFTPVSNWNGTVPSVNYTTNTGSASTLDITVTAVADAPTVDIKDNTSHDDMISSIDDMTQTKLSGVIDAGGSITSLSVKDASGNTISIPSSAITINPTTGVWSAVVDVTTLKDGVLTTTLNAKDALGNTAPVVTDTIQKDTAISATITLNANITADDIITASETTQTIPVSGTVGGDVKEGDTVTLTVNNKTFSGTVAADKTFSINVAGSDLAADADKIINASVTTTDTAGNTVSASDTESYTVNNAPISTDDTIALFEDMNNTVDIYTLTKEDFGTHSDIENNPLSSVRIDSLPSNGTLYLNGIAVAVSTVISIADINSGKLTFDPTNNSDADSLFSFSVNNGTNWSTDSYTSSVDITAVADAPTVDIAGNGVVAQVIDMSNILSTDNGFTITAFGSDGSASTISTYTDPIGFGVVGNTNITSSQTAGDSEIGYRQGVGSEALVVNFDHAVSSIDVAFSWRNPDETAKVEFYQNGVLVGSNTYAGGSDKVDSNLALKPSDGLMFNEVRFSAPGNGDDYLINTITFNKKAPLSTSITSTDNSTVALDVFSSLTDKDASETLSTQISGLPIGYTLTDGSHTFTATAGSSVVDVTDWNLIGLSLIVPAETTPVTVSLTVTATATESSNGSQASTSKTIDIVVTPQNDPTIANNDSVVINEDTSVVIDVLANDIDNESTKSPVASVTNGVNGTVSINTDGTLTYTPKENFNGTDSFTYTNAEGHSAIVEVTVNAVDDATTIVNDNITTDEDTSINIDVLANDMDSDSVKSPVASVTNGANGVVSINADGTLTYTPKENFNGTDSFTYTNAEGNSATVNVTVNAVADAPMVDIVGSAVVSQVINIGNLSSTTNGFSVTALNANGTVGTISTHTNPVGFGVLGTASGDSTEIGYLNGVGSETLVVNFDHAVSSIDVAFSWRNPGETAKVDFYQNGILVGSNTYTGGSDKVDSELALKPTDGSVFNEVRFSASGSGDDYLINSIFFDKKAPLSTSIMTTDNSAVSLDIFSSLADKDASETLSTHISGLPVGYTITDGTHTFMATAGSSVTDVTGWNLIGLSLVVPTETTSVTLTLTVTATATESSNTSQASTSKTIDIVVTPQNDPTIANDDSVTTYENTPLRIDVLANDTDNDSEKSSVVSVTNGANGSVTIDADGTLTYTPKADFNGTDSFIYTNTEGHSAVVSVSIIPQSDRMLYDPADSIIDGGSGIDTLILAAGENIDFSALDNVKNIEVIDLNENGSHNIINLTLQDVINLTDSNNTLTILGGSDDSVTIPTATGNYSVTQTADAGFDVYTYSSSLGDPTVTVKVEADVTHA